MPRSQISKLPPALTPNQARGGVNKILTTEKIAASKIEEARRRRLMRLKDAEAEAQSEIERMKQTRREKFDEFLLGTQGCGTDAALKVDHAARVRMAEIAEQADKHRDAVIEDILQLVCDIKPELHRNYRRKDLHPARDHHDGDDRRGSGVSGGPGGRGGPGGPGGPGGLGGTGGPGALGGPGAPGGGGTMYLPGDVPDRGSKMSPSPAGGTGENNRRFSDLKGKDCVCPRSKSPTKKAYLSQLRSPNSPMFCGKQSDQGVDSTVPMMDCKDDKLPDEEKLPKKNKPIEDKVPVKDKPPNGTKESCNDSKLPCLFNCKEVVAQAVANCDKVKTQAPIAANEKDDLTRKGSLHSCRALAKTLKCNGSPTAFPTAPSLMTKQSIPCNQNPSITFSDPNTAYGKLDETDAVSLKDNKKSVTSHPCASYSNFDGTSNVASKKNVSLDPSGGHVKEDVKQRKVSIDPTTYTPVKQLWTKDQQPTVQFQDGKKAEDSGRSIEEDPCAVYTSAKLQDTKVKFTPYANVDPNDPCSVFTKYIKDATQVMEPAKGEAAESPVSTPTGGQKNQDGVEPVARPCTVCGPNLRDVCAKQCHTNSKCSYECWASQKTASIKTICLCPENPDLENNKKSDKHKCGAGASKQR